MGTDFFAIDPKTGAVHLVNPIDREAYWFEDMEEPSVYLKLKIRCPSPAETAVVLPLHLHDLDNVAYDPTSTLVQLVILDTNDNPPVFPEKHMTIGYPVSDVADTIMPNYLVQVKVSVCVCMCIIYVCIIVLSLLQNLYRVLVTNLYL